MVSEGRYSIIETNLIAEGIQLKKFTKIDSAGVPTHAVIAINRSKSKAYVAFPGLNDDLPGIRRILFGRNNTTDMKWDCHGGILPYYLPLKDILLETLNDLHRDGITDFTFTGHCRGGSTASIAMVDFLEQTQSPSLHVQHITFAQLPAVFRPETADALRQDPRFKGHRNIWLQNDLWKRFSRWLDWWKGYVPLGVRTEIEPAPTGWWWWQTDWWWNTHRLSAYISALEPS